jgi:alkylation response protein AidB-like acyl-CoA dehydrogenase
MSNDPTASTMSIIGDEVTSWVDSNWDPAMTLSAWWQLLAEARYTVPHWPVEYHGRGWSRQQTQVVLATLRSLQVPGPPAGLGIMLAGPTILAHGTEQQKRRFLPDIITGNSNWCQLFSEPGAGSDLASVQTRAVRGIDGWTVTGQKVWTSNGHLADHGMLLARTDDSGARHGDLTWFAIEMEQPGIEVRPLREMTGRSLFTEVFIDEARVFDEDIVGELHDGWRVTRTTLMNERVGLGGGGGAVGGTPGTRGGLLGSRAGDSLAPTQQRSGTSLIMRGRCFDELRALASESPAANDPIHRSRLVELYVLERLAKLTQQRIYEEGPKNSAFNVVGSISKLLSTRSTRLARDVGMGLLGAQGMLWAQDRSGPGVVQELFLFSPAASLYGGTDQIQMNILAERALGLPRTERPGA